MSLQLKDFEKLGMAGTKDKTGILIFILFEEKYFDVLADEGIYEKIPDEVWNTLEAKLKDEFANGYFFKGIMHIIERVGEVLAKEFPRKADDVNELPDEIVVN